MEFQVMSNYWKGHTGQLSAVTMLMVYAGFNLRIFDLWKNAYHLLPYHNTIFCGILMAPDILLFLQLICYWSAKAGGGNVAKQPGHDGMLPPKVLGSIPALVALCITPLALLLLHLLSTYARAHHYYSDHYGGSLWAWEDHEEWEANKELDTRLQGQCYVLKF